MMETLFKFLIPLSMLAVVAVLALGIGSFAKTDSKGISDGHRQNRLMRWRIGLQFFAFVIILIAISIGAFSSKI